MLAGGGLAAQYFHNIDFTGLSAERTEAVDFNWGSGSPTSGVDPDTFSVRWSGQVEPLYSEQYTFYTTSNQGVRLWIDGQLLIDHWDPHNTEVDSASVALTAGQRVDLRLDYFEQFGSAEIHLEWSSTSQSRQIIPAAQLYASPLGLLGQYSDVFGGNAVQVDPEIDFDWGIGRAHPNVAVDRFEVAWTGQLRADFSEEYTFSITSDEAARLWIGGELIIEDWALHTTHAATGSKLLEVGKWYDLRLEYSDQSGHAEVDFKWSSISQTGANAFELVPGSNLRASKTTPLGFSNPLGPGADPFVLHWDGQYYMVNTTGNNVRMERANNLEDIHISNPASSSQIVWEPPGGLSYSEQIWAPELHRLNGKWYIYVAASDGNNENHRMHVLEREDLDPLGPYTYVGQLNTGANGLAIDGTVLPWQDQLYFIWSGWPGSTDGQQNLYIAQMSDPITVSTSRVLLSSPTLSWERHGLPINEGPQVLIHDDMLHIIYSASGYWTDEYALGRLTYDGIGPIMSPSSWLKVSTPVFQQAGEVVGTGHASFTTSPDGTENWIVYHAHHDKNVWLDDRDIYIQPFEFDPSGRPDFGSPLPKDTRLPVPSGQVSPERPFVAGDFDASGQTDADDLVVWNEQYAMELFPGISADGNGDGRVNGYDFLVWQRSIVQTPEVNPTVAYWRHEEGVSGSAIPAGPNTILDSSPNANHMRTFDPAFTSASYSSAVSPVPLRSGLPNTLSLDFGPGGDDLGRNDDNYADGKPINGQRFEAMTIELAFNLNAIGGFQTLVGKDGKPTSSPVAPLQIKVRGDDFPNGIQNQLFAEWIDGDGDVHFLASRSSIATGVWNHVAFVLAPTFAEMYLASETGDYLLVDAIYGADFAGAGGEVLIDSSGNFTVGRGMFNGNIADWSDALIDEVRISIEALAVDEFLFDALPASDLALLTNSELSIEQDAETSTAAVMAAAAASLAAVSTHLPISQRFSDSDLLDVVFSTLAEQLPEFAAAIDSPWEPPFLDSVSELYRPAEHEESDGERVDLFDALSVQVERDWNQI